MEEERRMRRRRQRGGEGEEKRCRGGGSISVQPKGHDEVKQEVCVRWRMHCGPSAGLIEHAPRGLTCNQVQSAHTHFELIRIPSKTATLGEGDVSSPVFPPNQR